MRLTETLPGSVGALLSHTPFPLPPGGDSYGQGIVLASVGYKMAQPGSCPKTACGLVEETGHLPP